jgi:predicted O-methyltransferase YrrM
MLGTLQSPLLQLRVSRANLLQYRAMQGLKTYPRKMKSLPSGLYGGLLSRTWPLYLSVSSTKSSNKYSLGHLRWFGEVVVGPVQRGEALLLYGLVKTVDPKTVVEFGFYKGHSAVNFLKAISSDSRLYSYDISDMSAQMARRIHDQRFRFIHKSQADFEWSDVGHRQVDFAFFDAAHDFRLNVETFGRLRSSLAEKALIVVHDTGEHGSAACVHQPDERRFVNYIKLDIGDFDQIHLHSTTKLRHGLTLLQRDVGPLPL